MKEFKGIKGRWAVIHHDKVYKVINEVNVLVAECDHYNNKSYMTPTPLACEANAQLIAAAPELLEALIELVANGGLCKLVAENKNSLLSDRYLKAELAINKALGL